MSGKRILYRSIGVPILCVCLLVTGCGASGDEDKTAEQKGELRIGSDAANRARSVLSEETVRSGQAEPAQTTADFDEARAAEEASVPRRKDEMIQVQADTDGSPKKIEVSGTLTGFSGEDSRYMTDVSGLSELKNATGEEEFYIAEDGTVYWENLGEDIHYEGISDAELPVDVRVTYFLNDEEMPLSELKGKNGEVRIRFDYAVREKTNVTVRSAEQEMTVPFLALSMVTLPEDHFSEVEVSHGGVMMLSGQKAAFGYALPGLKQNLNLTAHEDTEDIDLPDYVEITAQAEDFSLDFTATILKPGLFRDLDEEKLSSLEEEIGEADELEDAVKELEDAAQKLVDGTTELQGYMLQYANGVNQVAAAIGTINQGIGAYDLSAMGQMAEQLQQIAALSQAGDSLQQVSQLAQMAEPLRQVGALAEPLAQTAQLSELAAQIEAAAAANPESPEWQALLGWAEPLRGYAGLAVYAESLRGIAQYADAVAALSGVGDAASGLQQLAALGDAATQVTQMQTGLQELQSGLAQLTQGTAVLPATGQALYDGMTELVNGTTEFRDGISEFREEGIQELTGFFKDDLGDLLGRVRGLRQVDRAYNGYTPSQEGQEVSVSFLIETEGTK